MAIDPTRNFARTELTSGHDSTDTELEILSGDESKFPVPSVDGAFNLIWWNITTYQNPSLDPEVEIVRCTAVTSNVFTVTRAQEGTAASNHNTPDCTYAMMLALTRKTMEEIDEHMETTGISGSNGDVQFNTGGAFDSDPKLNWNDAEKILQLGDAYKTSPVKIPDVITPTERIVDGGLEEWNMMDLPTYWELGYPGDGTIAPGTWAKTLDSYSGVYALWESTDVSLGGGTYVGNLIQQLSTATNSNTFRVRLRAKCVNASGGVYIVYICVVGGVEYSYNFTGAGAGTWTTFEGFPGPDQIYVGATTSSYILITAPQATLPAAGVQASLAVILPYSGSSSGEVTMDAIEFLVNSVNTATDGGLESWTQWANYFDPMVEWTQAGGFDWQPTADSEGWYINRENSIIQEGSYAAKFYIGASRTGSGNRGYIYQTYSGSAGTSLDAEVYTRTTSGATPYLIFLNGTPGVHTQAWNFVTEVWQSNSTAPGTYPDSYSQLAKVLSGTTSYVANNATVPIPASGYIVMVLMTDDGQGAMTNYDFYFDAVSLTEDVTTPGNTVTCFDSRNASDYSELGNTDTVWRKTLTGGTDVDIWSMNKDGVVTTEIPSGFDFSGQSFNVATPSAAAHAVRKDYLESYVAGELAGINDLTIHRLGYATDIDCASTPILTLLYQVPDSTTAVVTHVVIKVTSASGWIGDLWVKFGSNSPDWDNWMTLSDIGASDSLAGRALVRGPLSGFWAPTWGTILYAGDEFKVQFDMGTATTLTVDVDAFGYLITA